MHIWGDKWEGWDELSKAEIEVEFWGTTVGRIGGQIKEKFGEIRWHAHLGAPQDLHDIVNAGYIYNQWCPNKKPFLAWINNTSKGYICLAAPLFLRYKEFMYGFAYHIACKRHPTVKREILGCVNYEELLFKAEKKFLAELRATRENIDE